VPDNRSVSSSEEPKRCPACGDQIEPLPVVFGYPAHETFEEAEAGKIRLGGCVVGPDDPTLACPNCNAWLATDATGILYRHPGPMEVRTRSWR
jgi:hypothetical protein